MPKMTKMQKRVQLAKDVLAQFAAEKFVVREGNGYCHTRTFERFSGVPLETPVCEVCAVGAMMVACCGVRNLATIPELYTCLSPLFSAVELAQIEAAFERDNRMPLSDTLSAQQRASLLAFVSYAPRLAAPQRMQRIMRNIIRNGGKFVLPKRLQKAAK